MIQGLGQGLRIHPSSESQSRAAGRDTQNSLPGGGPAFQKGKSINPLVYFRPSAFVYAANARQAHRVKAHTYLWMMYTEKLELKGHSAEGVILSGVQKNTKLCTDTTLESPIRLGAEGVKGFHP